MSEAALGSPLVAIAYGVAGLLFLVALRQMAITPRPWAGRMAAAALMIAMAATVYTLDAVSLPEMAGAVLVGGGIGWLAVRAIAVTVPQMIVGLQGLLGVAAMLMAVAIWLDPFAFGIDGGNRLVIFAQGACFAMGAVSAAGSAILLRNWDAPTDVAPTGLAALNRGMGFAVAAIGCLLDNWAMIATGGLLASSAFALGFIIHRTRGRGLPPEHPLP